MARLLAMPDVPAETPVARRFSSPLARRLAREAGLAIDHVVGTGPGDRIVRRDVMRAIATLDAVPAAAVGGRLTAGIRGTPSFTIEGRARVDRLLKLRARVNATAAQRVSVNDLVVMAVARAHVGVPAMNVIWTADGVRSFAHVDVALAVATEGGLVTPVLRDVQDLRLRQVAAETSRLIARARSGQLRPQDIEGGSISVANLGPGGPQAFSAIINPPHAAILAVGAARREPVVAGSRIVAGTLIQLRLGVDHRPVDGAVAAAWMAALIGFLEDPVSMLV